MTEPTPLTPEAVMLTQWARCVQRLMRVAPVNAIADETGLRARGHATPPERQAIRAEAHATVDRWLARDLATLDAARTPDVGALREALGELEQYVKRARSRPTTFKAGVLDRIAKVRAAITQEADRA